MPYEVPLAIVGVFMALASFLANLEGHNRLAKSLFVLSVVHVSPLLFLLWLKVLFGS
jgi:hypothetical protein